MLDLTGSATRLCDGLTRRDWLQIGKLSALGLGLEQALQLSATQADSSQPAPHFGRAKNCILVFLTGSPPQHETFDPTPAAPAEVQGEMQAIDTNVPGLQICERLPGHARSWTG